MRTFSVRASLGLQGRGLIAGGLLVLLASACGAQSDPRGGNEDPLGRAPLAQKKAPTTTSCTTDTDMDGQWQDSCLLHGGERTECSGGVAWCCRACTKQEGCEERCSQNPDDLDRSAATPPLEPTPDEMGIEHFADACRLSGGGITLKDEQSACCTICTDAKSCLDVCTDAKAVASVPALSREEDARLDEIIQAADPSYTERQSGSDVDTYNLCLSLCKWGYNVCTSAPVPVPHDDQFSFCTKGLFWGCIGGCFDIWHQ